MDSSVGKKSVFSMICSKKDILNGIKKNIMTKLQKKVGIDVSKLTFDVNYINSKEKEVSITYDYTDKGINKFINNIDVDYHCVMEATGVYHSRLAYALYKAGISVSIVNPLVIKNFSRALMLRTKTDTKDAQLIRRYAERMQEEVKYWKPKEDFYEDLQQIYGYVEMLEKQKQMNANQLEAINHRYLKNKLVYERLKVKIVDIENEIEQLMTEIETILKEHLPQQTKNVRSITGIGRKGTIVLLVATQAMENFQNHRQLSSYFGLCPRIYNSGTSIKSKGHICKMGLSWARKVLYMCSFSALQYNPACSELYNRLIANGKNGKVALIAVANKLLKIAFALVKNDQEFNKNYVSKLAV